MKITINNGEIISFAIFRLDFAFGLKRIVSWVACSYTADNTLQSRVKEKRNVHIKQCFFSKIAEVIILIPQRSEVGGVEKTQFISDGY